MKTAKIQHGVVDFVRDGLGLVTTGVLSQSPLAEIGAVAGYLVAPKIEATSEGKAFNKMFAVLMFFDRLMERFTPKGVF